VLLFIDKLEHFIEKAQTLKEEKRKMRLNAEPPNEVLVSKQRELDSIQGRIREVRGKIKGLRVYFTQETENMDVMVNAENELKNMAKVLEGMKEEREELERVREEHKRILDVSGKIGERKEEIGKMRTKINEMQGKIREKKVRNQV